MGADWFTVGRRRPERCVPHCVRARLVNRYRPLGQALWRCRAFADKSPLTAIARRVCFLTQQSGTIALADSPLITLMPSKDKSDGGSRRQGGRCQAFKPFLKTSRSPRWKASCFLPAVSSPPRHPYAISPHSP